MCRTLMVMSAMILANGFWYIATATGAVSLVLAWEVISLKRLCIVKGYEVESFRVIDYLINRDTVEGYLAIKEGEDRKFLIPVIRHNVPDIDSTVSVYILPGTNVEDYGKVVIPFVYGYETDAEE